MVLNNCRKTHESFFWRSHRKLSFMGENLLAKVTQNFLGKFGGHRAKILRTPKNLPAPTFMSRGWPKIVLQKGPKVAKLHFHHSKVRKQLFVQIIDGKMSNFKILGGLALPSGSHVPKTFYNKNIFTNKHIMNFENNSH